MKERSQAAATVIQTGSEYNLLLPSKAQAQARSVSFFLKQWSCESFCRFKYS